VLDPLELFSQPLFATGLPLCAEVDPEAFFPEKGGSTRQAKELCARCEVRAECLLLALERHEKFGVWGGTTERERRKMIHARATLAAVESPARGPIEPADDASADDAAA
jgi:WhiB family redox-sensing transcriptional regulator